MRQVKCWVCNNWTSEDLIEMMDFEGSQAPVCFECAATLEVRDKKLRAIRRQRNVTPSTGTSLASQLASQRPGESPDDGASQGEGTEPQPMGEGSDAPSGAVKRATQCAAPGCAALAVHTQLWRGRKDGKFATTYTRRCEVHKYYKDDVDPTWVLEAVSTTG